MHQHSSHTKQVHEPEQSEQASAITHYSCRSVKHLQASVAECSSRILNKEEKELDQKRL